MTIRSRLSAMTDRFGKGNTIAAGGGTVAIFAGVVRSHELLSNSELWSGVSLGLGGVALLGATWINRAFKGNQDKKQTRNIMYIYGATGIVLGSILSMQGDTTSEKPSSVEHQNTSTSTSTTSSCELSLPLVDSDKASVLKLQAALLDAGYDVKKVDGKDGPVTKAAIGDFKEAHGFSRDDIFNDAMCQLLPVLVDGNASTPDISNKGGNS